MNAVNGKYVIHLVPNRDCNDPINTSIFDKIVGQAEAIRKLRFFIESHSDATPFPNMLFTGSQGLGKSFMSAEIAKSMNRELVEVNCGTIESSKDLVEGILMEKVMGDTPKILLLDEAHKLSPDITALLLTLLNPNKENKNLLAYKNWLLECDFRNVATILATTDAHRIFKPLVNRCTEVYFRLYDNKDLFRIVRNYCKGVKITASKTDVAYACRGRARDAFILSQNIQRYCVMHGANELTPEGWKSLKQIFSVHNKGLKTSEVDLMKILADSGPMSCNNLAIKMGVNPDNIESELEIRPRELGLLKSTPKGRCLTKDGEKYLATIG